MKCIQNIIVSHCNTIRLGWMLPVGARSDRLLDLTNRKSLYTRTICCGTADLLLEDGIVDELLSEVADIWEITTEYMMRSEAIPVGEDERLSDRQNKRSYL